MKIFIRSKLYVVYWIAFSTLIGMFVYVGSYAAEKILPAPPVVFLICTAEDFETRLVCRSIDYILNMTKEEE